MRATHGFGWTLAITSLAWFLFTLDRLVVTTALPTIRHDLGATFTASAWTITAYTATFAVLLLAGAALGDRFGRRRVFQWGVGVFTLGSAAAAMAPTMDVLVMARGVQGIGGAIFTPLTLTMLSAATPAARRGSVLGAWGGIGGLGVAAGPLVGGSVTTAFGWPWVFWINVPLGAVLVLLARLRLDESHGPSRRFDGPGVVLSGLGLLGLVWGVAEGPSLGWSSPGVGAALGGATLALVAFVVWEARAPAPMLPLRFFRSRAFSAANLTALLLYAAQFGGLFLITQLLQTGLGATALEAGVRTLPMVVMPVVFVPVGGLLCDRLGPRPLMVTGVSVEVLALGWLAAAVHPGVAYATLVPALVLVGLGSALFFAPLAGTVVGAVAHAEQGQASGVATAVREAAAVIGVAVLGSVVTAHGDASTPARVLAGAPPAFAVAAALAVAALVAALALPRRPRSSAPRRAAADDRSTPESSSRPGEPAVAA